MCIISHIKMCQMNRWKIYRCYVDSAITKDIQEGDIMKIGYTITKSSKRETPLQSAIRKLEQDDSKVTHFEPAERDALRELVQVIDGGVTGGG